MADTPEVQVSAAPEAAVPEPTPAVAEAQPAESPKPRSRAAAKNDHTEANEAASARSKEINAVSSEIDDLWAQATRQSPEPEAPAAEPAAKDPPPEPVAEAKQPEAKKDDAPKVDEPPADQAELERRAYEKVKADYERQAQATRAAEERVRSEQQFQERVAAYTGNQADYDAVNAALRLAARGDYAALDNLDVLLPNGKRVSEVKGGQKGLTQEEAAGVLDAWESARTFQDIVGDAKVQRILSYWNNEVMTALQHPDVDAASVTQHAEPFKQMQALRDSVIASVTKRLTEAHTAEVKAKDAEIAKLTERVNSLVNERGNLVSQATASQSATPERQGAPGQLRRDIPSPDELAAMSTDEAFKHMDRIFASIPGGLSRAG